ncbi:hypothetical protein [Erwinia sp. V71]|uniref:HofO family protein n=1 Tax=Erwinia sp. V71 TaxID=3369424 RepID=UPI003F5FB65A
MSEWLLRWQYLPRQWQWLTMTVLPLVVILVLACGWLQPLRSASAALAQQSLQLQQRYDARMAQLRSQPELAIQRQQNQQLLQALQAQEHQHFSLVTLMQSGAALDKWQPAAQGGELTLLLSWPQFQHTIVWLASRRPPVMINSLSLQRSGEQLRMALSLGLMDEK